MESLRGIVAFVRTVSAGSFSEAAQALHSFLQHC